TRFNTVPIPSPLILIASYGIIERSGFTQEKPICSVIVIATYTHTCGKVWSLYRSCDVNVAPV
ncbi:MAG TPA: hypothetical protein PLM83_07755, partial [Bacillota bacterium]|nr:hypothetical protein [Bacillota bacterium]